MFTIIQKSSKSQIGDVIRFLYAKGNPSTEIPEEPNLLMVLMLYREHQVNQEHQVASWSSGAHLALKSGGPWLCQVDVESLGKAISSREYLAIGSILK